MGRCDLLTLSLNRKGAKSAKMGSGTLVKKKESGVKSCIVNNREEWEPEAEAG
jgi:hypothetical protein